MTPSKSVKSLCYSLAGNVWLWTKQTWREGEMPPHCNRAAGLSQEENCFKVKSNVMCSRHWWKMWSAAVLQHVVPLWIQYTNPRRALHRFFHTRAHMVFALWDPYSMCTGQIVGLHRKCLHGPPTVDLPFCGLPSVGLSTQRGRNMC